MALKKLKKPEKKEVTMDEKLREREIAHAFQLAKDYENISEQIKLLDETKKINANIIKDMAGKYGVKDDKGSSYLENDEYQLGQVACTSVSMNEDKLLKLLREKGLGDVIDRTTTVVETVSEAAIQKLISQKKLSLKDLEAVTETKVTYKVSVKRKEEMPQVEVKKVARKKK